MKNISEISEEKIKTMLSRSIIFLKNNSFMRR